MWTFELELFWGWVGGLEQAVVGRFDDENLKQEICDGATWLSFWLISENSSQS